MAKTLKQMLKGYEPKAEDEKRFKDKHTVQKHEDPNGNKDDVFTGSNLKSVDREATRHGYNPGKDADVYEASETPKKNQDVADKAYLKHKPGTVKGTLQQFGRFVTGKPEIKEEEEIEEKLAPNATAGDYIKDFQKSDAPQFKGKSKEERRKMAIAAFLSKEEVEQEEDLVEEIEELDEDVDITLLELYAQLDETNQDIMVRMIEEGRKDELLQFLQAIEE